MTSRCTVDGLTSKKPAIKGSFLAIESFDSLPLKGDFNRASSRIRFSNVKRFAINTHKIIADIIPAKILRFAPESGLGTVPLEFSLNALHLPLLE
jgi:hypothetical protein